MYQDTDDRENTCLQLFQENLKERETVVQINL